MLQANRPNRALHRVPRRRRTRARLPLVSLVVVHRTRDVARASDLRLDERGAGGGEEEGGGWGRAQGEGEGAVGADGDARGDGGPGYVVGGAGVEFLEGDGQFW